MNQQEGHFFICTGPCEQGRKDCPCPESCQLQKDDPHEGWGAWVVPFFMVLAIVAVALLGHASGYLPGGY